MKPLFILFLYLFIGAPVFAQFASRIDKATDIQNPLKKERLTIKKRANVDLFWSFDNNGTDLDISSITTVEFKYGPSSGAWEETITGSVSDGPTGLALVQFDTSNSNTNGTYQFDLILSDATTTLLWTYGEITLINRAAGDAGAGAPSGTSIDWSAYTGFSNTDSDGPYTAGTNITFDSPDANGKVAINSTGGGGSGDLTEVQVTGGRLTVANGTGPIPAVGLTDSAISSAFLAVNPSTVIEPSATGTSEFNNDAAFITGATISATAAITVDGATGIVSGSNNPIRITPNGVGDIILDGQKWPQADGTAGEVLTTDGLGQTSWDGTLFTTADNTKLDGIEAGADVTDETNVKTALDGATISSATVAGTDKVLIQDIDDSDNLKTVTAQSIADLGGGGGGSSNWSAAWTADDLTGPHATGSTDLAGALPAELDTGSFTVSGLSIQSDETTQQGLVLRVMLTTPEDATDLRTTNCFKFTVWGTSTASADCKYDLTIYGYSSTFGTRVTVDTLTNQTVTTADTPEVVTLDTADLTNSTLQSHYVLEFTPYTEGGDYISLVGGSMSGD